ncbi:DNA excision repair protein ERCC-6-like [Anolis carolinensis]|uniref:DNA excision repair protein ERCC-6-like n=1 Tax=Anolis carolinensis TaxID=28377 RepID=H9GQ92_ANOCA|nr:PREDICTED: DNA excision repair protein ERCC-6-like [Anolis carolinensis]|eukprot:XP_003227847.1 PREDICTED: DNA excision repair protein ERCC-6-like [Anolis carolinensis]
MEDPVEQYRRYVSKGKQEARDGNLEESIRLFRQALAIHPSEKLTKNIKKMEEALASLALDQEEEDSFVDVCQSGLMMYGEMYDKLFEHQREGVAFLYGLYRDGKKGGILADDMGLGKTIQIIAFLSGMFDEEHIKSVLLIVPTTLISNWTKEFASWTPGLRVKVFHGTCIAERNRNLEWIQRRHGILLTTYQMVLNNWQQLASFGNKEFVWDYAILDEAHKIKTPSAKTTKSVHAIPSKNRILLTGTPVQNNLKELWALFDFACQGSLLGTMKTFRMEYENPITRARAKDATPGEKALGLKISENLMSIIKPYFLRRSKDELKKTVNLEQKSNLPALQSKDAAPPMPSLPRKNDFIVWVYLAPIQEEIYRKFISLDHIKELLMTTRSPLAELNILKKLCDHPRLLSARACSQLGLETSSCYDLDGDENEANDVLHQNIEHLSDQVLIEESGKLLFLVALLDRLQEEGHRTLVFSQSRKMLDIIERILTRRRFKLMRIDGTVTHLTEREKRIGMFQKNSEYSVFLLTTQVGGVGLTLTAATRVVIFDPSWNPATDAQAVDRAYRIGQKANVVIYRLITCGTVEEKIYRRQVFKDSLIRQSTGEKKNPYRYFSNQELRELFTLEDPRSSSTQLQLQSLHSSQRKTDTQLDEHIAYLHSLEIFGISDHDLMYTHETVNEDEAENEEDHRYIEHRVQKAQELVQLESQLKDQLVESMGNTTEGAWLRETELSTQPKKKTPRPPQNHVSPAPVQPTSDGVVDLVTDNEDDNMSDEGSDCHIINVSSKMASLVIEDVDDEQILQDISNMDVSLSKKKEDKPARLQAYEQEHDQRTMSPLPRSNSFSNKENSHPELQMISSDPLAQDVDNEQLWNKSDMDVSVFKSEDCRSPRLRECKQEQDQSTMSPFPQAKKQSYHPEFSPTSHDPLALDVDNKSDMDISLAKNEECNSPQLQQNSDSKRMPSFLAALSLSYEENRSPESQTIPCDLSAEASVKFDDVQVEPLHQLSASSDDEKLTKTELTSDVKKLHEEASEIYELDTSVPFQPHANNTSKCSAVQKSEIMLEEESFTTPSPYQTDFNLVLDDSEDGLQVALGEEMSLEETENEGFQLQLDSHHSSASHSWAGGNEGNGSLQPRKDMMGSPLMEGFNRLSDASMDNSEISLRYKKKPIRRIVSDDEEEQHDSVTELDDSEHEKISALNNIGRICMSTPKANESMASLGFSPRLKVSGRRSTASRRSLANLVMDQVEDMAEVVEPESEGPPQSSLQESLESEMSKSYSDQEPSELEEEPSGETVDSEDTSSYMPEISSLGDESSF